MNKKNGTKFGTVWGLLGAGILLMAAVTLVKPVPVKAWANTPCDFLTGGGWVVHKGGQTKFWGAGGCKNGSPTGGHLGYQNNSTGLGGPGGAKKGRGAGRGRGENSGGGGS